MANPGCVRAGSERTCRIGLRFIGGGVIILLGIQKSQVQQAERISPRRNMKKAAMLTMMPTTGTHLFTPPSSDRVLTMSPEGCDVFTVRIFPLTNR